MNQYSAVILHVFLSTRNVDCVQDGCDCLHLAAANGHNNVAKLLLSYGADTTAKNAVSSSK